MIAIIGGPSKDEGKKPGMSMVIKSKPKKINGIGGEYSKDSDESDGPVMDSEEKMLEAARPLAKAMGVPSSTVVNCISAMFNLMQSEKPTSEEPVESEEGEE